MIRERRFQKSLDVGHETVLGLFLGGPSKGTGLVRQLMEVKAGKGKSKKKGSEYYAEDELKT